MQLLESSHVARRSRGVAATSVVAHVVLLGLAIRATAAADDHLVAAPVDRAIFVVRTPPTPPPMEARRSTNASGPATGPAMPTLPAPDIPDLASTELPSVETPLADPSRGALEALRHAAGGLPTGAGTPLASPDGVFSEMAVERAVVAIPGAVPRYPDALRGAGVEGRVVARFVVDTAGRVEPGSVQIVSAAHPAFAEAVRRTLPALRFRAAEAGGRRVRQLVDMPFDFVLTR
jgi:protein TonB